MTNNNDFGTVLLLMYIGLTSASDSGESSVTKLENLFSKIRPHDQLKLLVSVFCFGIRDHYQAMAPFDNSDRTF